MWACDPNCSRADWVRLGMAAIDAGLEFDEFNSWSAQAANYGGMSDTLAMWRSIKPGGVTERTLFDKALASGWRDDVPARAFKRAEPKRDPEPKRAPAWPVATAWDECVSATGDHPYIRSKGGMPDGLRVYPGNAPPRQVCRKDVRGWLAVPAFDKSGALVTLQFISPAPRGGKLNLPGHPVAGWFTLGDPTPGATVYVTEGVGAAWAAHQATGAAARVAFGAGNQHKVAEEVKQAGALPVIVADRGKEQHCEKAASEVGCAWVAMPSDLADNGDLDDIKRTCGLDAVRAVLRNARTPLAANDCNADGALLENFHAHMPTHSYLFVPTRDLWPAASVNGRITDWPKNPATLKLMKPSDWLDAHRPIEQMTWNPDEPELIAGRVMQVNGWAVHPGARVFNLYRAPSIIAGDARRAERWRSHLRTVYPSEADHIEKWLAQRVQQPGVKVNHALVLGGSQGTGKDTLLEPVRAGVGSWNWQDIKPTEMLGRFNGWAKAVVVRINELRDLGESDRFAFYDHSKTYIAAPPDVIRVDEKNLREHYVWNVMGVILTTNHKTDGLFLPPDDRRHFVAWSEAKREDFAEGYWRELWSWYQRGGIGDIVAFLRSLDITRFDPKAEPPKTAAFWAIVQTNEAPESSELRDILEKMASPAAFTIADLALRAGHERMFDLEGELKDRKNRRSMPHKLERVGYVPVRNPDADDGLFKVDGKRQAVYGQQDLTLPARIDAARALARRQSSRLNQ
ncbi:PriCT-2 domain-containing protein [Variovorax sp. OV329]|uniref:PriCT-2 domain-containing protein n=1 Tax=Variovorax sp. OV329 TaxID=1882825 RepID=UPI00267578DA|nr:PriCT-2 domain-containing protein [Variovorax sp. OV329]